MKVYTLIDIATASPLSNSFDRSKMEELLGRLEQVAPSLCGKLKIFESELPDRTLKDDLAHYSMVEEDHT